MRIWFTSDPHFSSTSTLSREKRPFKTVEDYNDYVINLWNSQVKAKDVIYVIGDFASSGNAWREGLNAVKRIKARVVLVMGNNEDRIVSSEFGKDFAKFRAYCRRLGFLDVQRYIRLKLGNHWLYLTHEPRNRDINCINLFGHVHKGVGQFKPFGFNMFLDLNYFRLYSSEDIEELIIKRNRYWIYSHNVITWERPSESVFN